VIPKHMTVAMNLKQLDILSLNVRAFRGTVRDIQLARGEAMEWTDNADVIL